MAQDICAMQCISDCNCYISFSANAEQGIVCSGPPLHYACVKHSKDEISVQ